MTTRIAKYLLPVIKGRELAITDLSHYFFRAKNLNGLTRNYYQSYPKSTIIGIFEQKIRIYRNPTDHE